MEPPVIFVVDDDASVRDAIRRLLLSLDMSIRSYASAEQFLDETPPGTRGCLILDMRLPGMSGTQLQRHLNKQHWNLPTVIVTAHDDNKAKDAAMRLGAVSYLLKPFDRTELLAQVHEAIARS
jgi:two-component system response regulator FixJ